MHLCTSESEREEIVGVKRGHIKRVVSSDNDADMVPVCIHQKVRLVVQSQQRNERLIKPKMM